MCGEPGRFRRQGSLSSEEKQTKLSVKHSGRPPGEPALKIARFLHGPTLSRPKHAGWCEVHCAGQQTRLQVGVGGTSQREQFGGAAKHMKTETRSEKKSVKSLPGGLQTFVKPSGLESTRATITS